MFLFVLPKFSGGGAERVTLNLLIELHNRGHSVGILVFDLSGPLLPLVPNSVTIYNLGTLKLRYSVISLVKKIHKINPEVIFSTLGYINMAILAIRWMLPLKTKIFVREANLPTISLVNNPYPRLMHLFYRFLYKNSDKVICTSERMKIEFISDFLVPDSVLAILHNPVDVDMIRKLSIPKKRFDKGGVCYVAAGRMTYQKGFDRLLNWFSRLDDKQSTLSILGDGSLKNKLIRQANSLSLKGRVKFMGFCDNPWQWYAGADVFLLSSRWEGMPNSVLESLACGTPVIATEESGGIKEIIECNDNNSDITVVKVRQFSEEMSKVKIKNKSLQSSSLLPEKYKKENVIATVEGWLDDLNRK